MQPPGMFSWSVHYQLIQKESALKPVLKKVLRTFSLDYELCASTCHRVRTGSLFQKENDSKELGV